MPFTEFNFYGIGVQVESVEEEFLRSVEHDFSYFLAPAILPQLRLAFTKSHPDYDGLPELTCSFATPRNICFSNGSSTYIDYFGQALNIYDRQANHCQIITEDLELAHEIAYLTILSRISEALERKRLHRIHGLGIEAGGKGIIILLPNGGGKTTMAMSLLRDDSQFRLISEDSPLLRPDGFLLPFPLRIGVHPESVPPDIDVQFTRLDKRIEFSPKINIDIRYFADRISRQPVSIYSILLGVRSTACRAQITPVSKRAALRHVFANSIIGIGLYQGLEFIFQKNFCETIQHLSLLLSRAYNNLILLNHAKVYRFIIGRDISLNYQCLREFLIQQGGNSPANSDQ